MKKKPQWVWIAVGVVALHVALIGGLSLYKPERNVWTPPKDQFSTRTVSYVNEETGEVQKVVKEFTVSTRLSNSNESSQLAGQ